MGKIIVAILVAWSVLQRGGQTAMAMERLANFSDELTVGRSSVRYGVRDTG